jgi:uncharacterized membrane protein YedE/YeeE
MKNNFSALAVGVLFAMGLGLSGMTQPQKVIGFLDLFGKWDPSLIFVMAGAIVVHAVTFRMIRKKKNPWFSKDWHIPNRKDVTPALVGGSLIFGFGWGLGGYCPGPAVTSLASLQYRPVIFVLSMIMGMVLFRLIDGKLNFKK